MDKGFFYDQKHSEKTIIYNRITEALKTYYIYIYSIYLTHPGSTRAVSGSPRAVPGQSRAVISRTDIILKIKLFD